jgi:hypothetical protein
VTSAAPARESLETFIADELGRLAARFGYAIGEVRFADAVEITLEHGGARFVVWLRPAGDDGSYYRKTARFRIGYSGTPPDRSALTLLESFAERIAAWERSVSDDEYRQVFASPRPATIESTDARELLAVRAGLKPASRHLLRRDRADDLAERARCDGLHVRITDAAAFAARCCGEGVAEHATTLVHVGRTEESADAAAGAEQSMVAACARGERVSDAQVRALGAALGYPACCIEAFLPIRDFSTTEIRFHALQCTPDTAAALLNNVDEGRALVFHSLCRYDCADSLRSARALLTELARLDEAGAERLSRELAGLVIMFRRSGALRLVLRGEPAASTFRYDGVDSSASGGRGAEWCDALSRGDAVEVHPRHVRVLRNGAEVHRLESPPDDVQIRLFT